MRLVWTTDPHLNHVPVDEREHWFQAIASHGADGIVISGDISEGDDVVFQLDRIAQSLAVPIYFVLGNHDFYNSSIGETRQSVIHASRESGLLHYLTDMPPIDLDDGIFLIGEDGWGDATEGDYEGSSVRLNDFLLIQEFQRSDQSGWKQQLQELGEASGQRLQQKLDVLPSDARHVLVITHVPPFCESCWYEGKTTDENWAPFFVCGRVGQTLRRASQLHPSRHLHVLCGHTHHAGVADIAPNLVVHTGGAAYGNPDVEGLVTTGGDGIEITILRQTDP